MVGGGFRHSRTQIQFAHASIVAARTASSNAPWANTMMRQGQKSLRQSRCGWRARYAEPKWHTLARHIPQGSVKRAKDLNETGSRVPNRRFRMRLYKQAAARPSAYSERRR
jgi:hypothetical protein